MTGLAAADPVRSGFDPARLARLDGFLDRLTEDGRIPGWSLAIARHGTLVHASTGGYRDIEAGSAAGDWSAAPRTTCGLRSCS
jgi:CubicO group peptidase (beta-lactamase class C family)